jgi:hypothetical protein
MQVNSLSGGGTSAQVYQVGVQTTRSTDLQIVTDEGDRVTISTDSIRTLGYASATAQSGNTSVAGAALQVSGSDSVSLSVEGELSHDELADLRKVIKMFQQAAARGDATRLLERLSKSELDTIASVSGSSTTETVVTVSELAASLPSAPAGVQGPPPPPPKPPEGERTEGLATGILPGRLVFDSDAARHKSHAGHEPRLHREEEQTRRDQRTLAR